MNDRAGAMLRALARGERSGLRLLVVAAHPDDETIGLGALLGEMKDAFVLHVTDGAPRDGVDAAAHGLGSISDYAGARRREAPQALALARIAPDRQMRLDVPDQGAACRLVEITHRIADLIARLRPGLVVTHAHEGGHPDHDATAFAVRAALRLRPAPLAEMTGYHAEGYGLAVGRFLPPVGQAVVFPLAPGRLAVKRRMLDCFATQRTVLAAFPPSDETLRPAPRADFTLPPHPGELFYERFAWGMTGARFRERAATALRQLELAA